MKLAREGAYDGTTFHRVDPARHHPGRRPAVEGSGEGGAVRHRRARCAEGARSSARSTTRGAVSAVLQPGKPDSAGAQFFVCVTDQPALDGQYTVFGRVSRGSTSSQKISETPADANGRADRARRDHDASRFATRRRPSRSRSRRRRRRSSRRYRAVLETSAGAITVEFFPDKAPGTRPQLPAAGSARRLRRHGVSPRRPGFVIQTGALTVARRR